MPVFQVFSESVPSTSSPKKRARRFQPQWYVVVRFLVAGSIAGLIFGTLVTRFTQQSHDVIFVLLPVLLSLATAQFRGYNLKALFTGTLVYLALTACLTVIYYSIIVLGPAFIQQNNSRIIAIATAVAWTIMFEPVRMFVQRRIERRFNMRNQETDRAIHAFTSTLREEIDLDVLRQRFMAIISQTMQPYSLSLWIRTSQRQQEPSNSIEETGIADDDPLLPYLVEHSGTSEIDHLQFDSPTLDELKRRSADLILPLASQGELISLLILGPHLKGEPYTLEERALLDTLAPQVAPALRVAQLVQERQLEARERDRIEQELSTARAIQQAFLPKEVPVLPGWQLAPYYQPAREVGGDFYDFLPFEDGRLGLVIGDVTGKGVPAALVMSTVQTMLRTTAQDALSPGVVLARVNDLLSARIPPGMFVTCFFALLDPPSGRLCYANAGHDLPYHQQKGSVSPLWATGMPLGMMPDRQYDVYEATITPGESLLFYSDGLVEAHNINREMFDTPRLKSILTTYGEPRGNDTSLIDVLLHELRCFTGEDWVQEDDVTLMLLHRRA